MQNVIVYVPGSNIGLGEVLGLDARQDVRGLGQGPGQTHCRTFLPEPRRINYTETYSY